jgi:HEAT repeat protein
MALKKAPAGGTPGALRRVEPRDYPRDLDGLCAQLADAAALALLPLLRSEDAMLRNGAIEVLGSLPDAVAPHIEALLADADGDVRIFSVDLLGLLPHPRVPQWLAQVLERETEVNVVGAALDVLAEVGGPELAGPLRRTLARFADEPYIRFAAELALQRIEAA